MNLPSLATSLPVAQSFNRAFDECTEGREFDSFLSGTQNFFFFFLSHVRDKLN